MTPVQLLRSLTDRSTPRPRRILRIVLLALLFAACAYRVWLIVRYNPMQSIWSDPARHWYNGARPADPSPMSAIDPVLYQIYIAVLVKLTAASPILVAYWTALLSLSGPWLWYRFLREALPDRDLALAGWVLLCALPSWSAIYSYFMQETLMLPLLGAALWATWRCRRKRDCASFVVAVGCWLLAGLTRGICLPLGAIAIGCVWLEQGGKFIKAAASLVLLLAVLGPLAGRSWSLAHLVSPHGIGQMAQLYDLAGTRSIAIEFRRRGGSERWGYNFTSPAVLRPPFEPFSNWRTSRQGEARFLIDLDAGNRDWKTAFDSLPPFDLRRAAWLTADNLILLFFSLTWPDTDPSLAVGIANYWLRWLWAPLAIACGLVTIAWRRRQTDWLLPALLVTWFVVQGLVPLSVNEGRYRKPFECLLLAQCLVLAGQLHASKRRQTIHQPALERESAAASFA